MRYGDVGFVFRQRRTSRVRSDHSILKSLGDFHIALHVSLLGQDDEQEDKA